MNESSNIIKKLREKAEQILKDTPESLRNQNFDDIEKLIHELDVHQIELQLQNKELEEARRNLEVSENKYFSLFENAPIGFLTLNDVSKIIELNFESSIILGDEKLNLVGNYFSSFIAPESQDEFYFHMQKIFREETVVRSEITLRDSHGKSKTVLLESKPFLKQQDYNLVLSILIDISEKKEIENKLLIEKESLESIYKIAPVAIFTINENVEISSWNRRCEEITGYNQYSLIGKTIDVLFDLKYFNILKIIRNFDYYNLNSDAFETAIVKKNGEKIIALLNIAQVDENNIIISFKDITESKNNENELKLFKNVFENINEPIFITDPNDNKILYVNKMVVKKTAIPVLEILNSTVNEVLFDKNEEILDNYNAFVQSNKVTEILHFEFKNKSNEQFYFDLYLNKFIYKSKKYLIIFALDKTLSNRYEEEIERSRDVTSAIIEKTPVGLCITDSNGYFEYVNPAYCDIYNYSKQELLGKHFTKVVSDDLKDFMKQLHDKFIEGVAEPRGEWKVVDKNGNDIFILADAARITGENGQKRKVTFVINITENKKSQSELKKSEERYRRLTESAKDIIYRYIPGPPSKIEFISPVVEEILGYTQQECYKSEGLIERILDKEYLDDFLNNINYDTKKSILRKVYDKSGNAVWLEDKGVKVYDEENNLVAIEGVARDITNRKMNEELQLQVNYILEKIALGHNIYDVFPYLIENFERQYSDLKIVIKLINPVSSDFDDIICNDDDFADKLRKILTDAPMEGAYGEAIRKEKLICISDIRESELHRNYNSIIENGYITSWANPIFIRKRVVFGTVNFYWKRKIDYSETKANLIKTVAHLAGVALEMYEAQNQLRTAKEAAEIANKTKSEFLANISHEIRTPMNAILGFTELLKNKQVDDKKHNDYLNGILVGGKSLLNLINDILDLSKIESGKLDIVIRSFSIRNLLLEIEQLFSVKAANKSIQYYTNVNSDLPVYIESDEIRLRQILFNLVGNAIKFTHEGKIEIQVEAQNISEKNKSMDLTIIVSDTGIGIPEEQHEAIFDSFHQSKDQNISKYEGTGLGLSITKRLVEMMNGQISLESSLNVGSSFIVKLHDVKFSTKFDQKDYTDQIDSSTVKFFGQKILYAEVDEINKQVIEGFLDNHNLKLIFASSNEDVFELISKFKPKLILLGLNMPFDKGIKTVKLLKNNDKTKDIPILIITAAIESVDIEIISKYSDDVIKKPVSKDDMISKLAQFLKHTNIKTNSHKNINIDYNDSSLYPSDLYDQEMIDFLKNNLYKKWLESKQSMIIDHLKSFAKSLNEFANDNNLKPFIAYSEELISYLETFNIERILKIIPYYEDMINNLEDKQQ